MMGPGRTAALDELRALYTGFDEAVDVFARASSIACPAGCGDCCDHADTEVTIAEARLIADYIRSSVPTVEDLLCSALSDEHRVACVFYDSTSPDHCRIYPVRPLICRAFGYSAYSDRTGNRLFAVCPSMPIARSQGSVMQVLFEPYPPVLEHYREQVLDISQRLFGSSRRLPLGGAVIEALQGEDTLGSGAQTPQATTDSPSPGSTGSEADAGVSGRDRR